jgi:hypothetical protein
VLGSKKGWVMGIYPLFTWGEANALFLWKFTLINKNRSINKEVLEIF